MFDSTNDLPLPAQATRGITKSDELVQAEAEKKALVDSEAAFRKSCRDLKTGKIDPPQQAAIEQRAGELAAQANALLPKISEAGRRVNELRAPLVREIDFILDDLRKRGVKVLARVVAAACVQERFEPMRLDGSAIEAVRPVLTYLDAVEDERRRLVGDGIARWMPTWPIDAAGWRVVAHRIRRYA